MPSSPPKGNRNGRSQLPPSKADGPNKGRKMKTGLPKLAVQLTLKETQLTLDVEG